jgi:hypothetical protein
MEEWMMDGRIEGVEEKEGEREERKGKGRKYYCL